MDNQSRDQHHRTEQDQCYTGNDYIHSAANDPVPERCFVAATMQNRNIHELQVASAADKNVADIGLNIGMNICLNAKFQNRIADTGG